jgi:hypothetical protein
MDVALRNALDGLKKSGALNLPSPSQAEAAPAGSHWHGRKKTGDRWMLIKHGEGSYNAEF